MLNILKHYRFLLIFFFIFGTSTSVFADADTTLNNSCVEIKKQEKQEENNKIWLKNLFKAMYSDPTTDFTKLIPESYSPNYTQWVDGKTMGYQDILKHRLAQKKVISDIKITFEHMIAKGDKVFTVHWVNAKKKDGSEVIVKVIALFQIQNGKLISCDEMTYTIKGSKEDQDLGSRH